MISTTVCVCLPCALFGFNPGFVVVLTPDAPSYNVIIGPWMRDLTLLVSEMPSVLVTPFLW